MQLDGFSVDDGVPIVSTTQADKDGGEGTIYINGIGDVAANKHGGCTMAQTPVKALYDTADGTPAAGDTWGLKKDSWKLGKDIDGFVVLGGIDSTAGTMYVVANGMAGRYDRIKCDLTVILTTATASAVCDGVVPISGANPTTGTADTLTVYNARTPKWDSDDEAECTAMYNYSSGHWEFDFSPCAT